MTETWLPATPSLRRIATGFLGFDPWDELHEACSTNCDWFEWINGPEPVLPLHIPAGLAIARLRCGEVSRHDRSTLTAEGARVLLLAYDPEMKEAPRDR
jgi:hypothetical protein